MTAKPPYIKKETVYTYFESDRGMRCPMCGENLAHEFNDGGREVVTLEGPLWVVTNYYRCLNQECDLHKAFPITHSSCIRRKRHSVEVWAKVIQHHFKFHLNYQQVCELIWNDWKISISESTVRNVCQYFEMAGLNHQKTEIKKEVRKNGKIFLSLDGAQPIEGEPTLWIFTDRLTDSVFDARLLERAPAEVLEQIYEQIEQRFGIPIVAVISDKQSNIVNSVKNFNDSIPHAYCQYHFLNHVADPINSKDSHLRTTLKKTVRSLSLVQNEPPDKKEIEISKTTPVAEVFLPVVEELKCAISTKGNQFKVFAGKEAYLNVASVLNRLKNAQISGVPKKVKRSFRTLVASLQTLLTSTRPLYNEVCELTKDFQWLRAIFSHREWSGNRIEKWVRRWISVLRLRLERANKEHRGEKLKWQQSRSSMSLPSVWQQWIRLEHSYSDGLYCAYDDPHLDVTNNAKEQLIHHTKAHFKSLLGRQNIARAYHSRGSIYAHLVDFDFSDESVSSVLLASETPLIEVNRRKHNAQYTVERRNWRIREQNTGNFEQFETNLQLLKNGG
jgi:hypothetical protein